MSGIIHRIRSFTSRVYRFYVRRFGGSHLRDWGYGLTGLPLPPPLHACTKSVLLGVRQKILRKVNAVKGLGLESVWPHIVLKVLGFLEAKGSFCKYNPLPSIGFQVPCSTRDNSAVRDGRSWIVYFPPLNIGGHKLWYVTGHLPSLESIKTTVPHHSFQHPFHICKLHSPPHRGISLLNYQLSYKRLPERPNILVLICLPSFTELARLLPGHCVYFLAPFLRGVGSDLKQGHDPSPVSCRQVFSLFLHRRKAFRWDVISRRFRKTVVLVVELCGFWLPQSISRFPFSISFIQWLVLYLQAYGYVIIVIRHHRDLVADLVIKWIFSGKGYAHFAFCFCHYLEIN